MSEYACGESKNKQTLTSKVLRHALIEIMPSTQVHECT